MDASLYLPVRQVHIASVHLSIALFLLRGMLMWADSRWLGHWTLRSLPHLVDTVLLTSALMLVTIIDQYPFVHGWLTVKVVLLVVYIALGMVAIKPGRPPAVRRAAFVAALVVFAFIYSVARAHHPLGIFARLGGF